MSEPFRQDETDDARRRKHAEQKALRRTLGRHLAGEARQVERGVWEVHGHRVRCERENGRMVVYLPSSDSSTVALSKVVKTRRRPRRSAPMRSASSWWWSWST